MSIDRTYVPTSSNNILMLEWNMNMWLMGFRLKYYNKYTDTYEREPIYIFAGHRQIWVSIFSSSMLMWLRQDEVYHL